MAPSTSSHGPSDSQRSASSAADTPNGVPRVTASSTWALSPTSRSKLTSTVTSPSTTPWLPSGSSAAARSGASVWASTAAASIGGVVVESSAEPEQPEAARARAVAAASRVVR